MRASLLAGICSGVALQSVAVLFANAATVTGTTIEPSIVWVSDGSTAPDVESQVHNQNRQFVPSLIVIRAGDSVRFPNDDPFFHSIYSASPNDSFDIGYYGYGPGKLV